MRARLISAFFSALRASATLGRAPVEGTIAGDRAGTIDDVLARRIAGDRALGVRILAGVRTGLWAALGTALSADEKSRLGVAMYDASDAYRDSPRHAWEDAWHARWLSQAGLRDLRRSIARNGEQGRDRDAARSPHMEETSVAPPEESDAIFEEASIAEDRGTSRVLVGAAGAGREVVAMLALGHEVVALEPSPALAALCRSRTEGRVTVIERRYEDLEERDFFGGAEGSIRRAVSRPSESDHARIARALRASPLDGAASGPKPRALSRALRASPLDGPASGPKPRALSRAERPPPFDAVLLGLGSLSHVLDAASRERLLGTLARACPRGPILASALTPPRGVTVLEAQRPGRAARTGRAIARPLRAARHLPPVEPGEIVFDALGFAKLFTHDELRALGATCGRRTIFDDGAPDGMALCAFVPEESVTASP